MKTITYEYLGSKFVENQKDYLRYISDSGEDVRGHYETVWMAGSETVSEKDLANRVKTLKRMPIYRNIQVN